MHHDPKSSARREPGLELEETRVSGLIDPHGRFRPNPNGRAGTFGGWGPKLG